MRGEKNFQIKDVKFFCKVDRRKNKIFFSLQSTSGQDYKFYEIKLFQSSQVEGDLICDKNESQDVYHGIYFHDGSSILSPKDFQNFSKLVSKKLADYFISITKFKSSGEESLSTSLEKNIFYTKYTKWFKKWLQERIESHIKTFVYSSIQSLLAAVDLERLEKQNFFLEVFAKNSWGDMHCKPCMQVIHHKSISDLEWFKKEFQLPIARKCLLYSNVIDGQICFNPDVESYNNFFPMIKSNGLTYLGLLDEEEDEDKLFYSDWKSFLMKSHDQRRFALLDNVSSFLKANFSYCYIKSFHIITNNVVIESPLDMRTAMCIAESLHNSWERKGKSDVFSVFSGIVQTQATVFDSIYKRYLMDRKGTIEKVCNSYPVFSGEKKTKAEIMRSMPLYSTSWSHFVEKQHPKKDFSDSHGSIVLDDDGVF